MFTYFEQVKDFLERNPGEFIILKVRGEGENLRGFCKNIVADRITEIFGEALVSTEDTRLWFDVENVTVGEIRASGKKVLVLVTPNFYEGFITYEGDKQVEDTAKARAELKKRGLFCRDKYLRDHNFKCDDITDLLKSMNQSFQKVDRARLRVNQYIFSIQKKLKLKYLFKPPTIYKLEASEFQENCRAMNHIVESIVEEKDVNIGRQ